MEKGSQGTALGLGSGGPKLTGEGRFLNVGHLDAPARRKGNGLIFPSLVVGGSGGDKARVERGSAYPLLRQRGCREGAPPRPAVQKGGNTNEVGDVRASPGGRYLFSLTGAHVGAPPARSTKTSADGATRMPQARTPTRRCIARPVAQPGGATDEAQGSPGLAPPAPCAQKLERDRTDDVRHGCAAGPNPRSRGRDPTHNPFEDSFNGAVPRASSKRQRLADALPDGGQ
jgi:hypothetical protein